MSISTSSYALRGFTLIEILVVIAIIAALVSVVLPALKEAREKANFSAVKSELHSAHTAMQELYHDTSKYPNDAASYCRTVIPANNEVDLSTANAGLTANGAGWSGWTGPYMGDLTDAWGNPYYLDEDYQCLAATDGCDGVNDPGTDSSVVVSCGPNGALADGACAYDDDNIVRKLCG